MGSRELCISVQNDTFRFVECKYNPRNKKIYVYKAFQVDVLQEFRGNKEAVIGLVRRALKENDISNKRYRLCISQRDIITRVIKLPRMDLRDLESFMKYNIQQYFPINANDYCFDYKIQDVNEKDEKTYYNLFLVAMPKAVLEYYAGVFLKCGLKPKLISIYSDVICNFFANFSGKDVAVMEMSYNYTEFVMLENKNIFINSSMDFSIPKPKENVNQEEYLANLSQEDLGEDLISVFEDLENYINFFASRHHGKTIDEIYFFGEGGKLGKIISLLKEDINIKVSNGHELFDDILITSTMPTKMKEQFYPERYLPCVGLLLGGTIK